MTSCVLPHAFLPRSHNKIHSSAHAISHVHQTDTSDSYSVLYTDVYFIAIYSNTISVWNKTMTPNKGYMALKTFEYNEENSLLFVIRKAINFVY
jgi:hypothetical protein